MIGGGAMGSRGGECAPHWRERLGKGSGFPASEGELAHSVTLPKLRFRRHTSPMCGAGRAPELESKAGCNLQLALQLISNVTLGKPLNLSISPQSFPNSGMIMKIK